MFVLNKSIYTLNDEITLDREQLYLQLKFGVLYPPHPK